MADTSSFAFVWRILLPVVALVAFLWYRSSRPQSYFPSTASPAAPRPAWAEVPQEPATPEYRGLLGPIRRHLNGDYSLARSYWLHTALLSALAPAAAASLLPWFARNTATYFSSAALLAVLVLTQVVWFIAVWGTVASANKHVARGGSRFWAVVAQLMMALSLLGTVLRLARDVPAIWEHIRTVAGHQPGPPTQAQVLMGGKFVRLSGGINDGAADLLARTLQGAPNATTVVLQSGGGWLREGRLLGELIRGRKLATYVEGECSSACTMAFLGGVDRAADPSARLGFHAGRALGATDRTPLGQVQDELRAAYTAAALTPAFVARAMETRNDRMWYPSASELRAAGVLTRASEGGETPTWAERFKTRDGLAAELERTAVISAIADKAPKDFQRAVDQAWAMAARGEPDARPRAAVQREVALIARRLKPLASDAALAAYWDLLGQEVRVLNKVAPKACADLVFEGRVVVIGNHVGPELAGRDQALSERLVLESNPGRARPSEAAAWGRKIAPLLQGLPPQERELFRSAAARAQSPQGACRVAVKLFDATAPWPAGERAQSARVFLGG